jgi:hypothetical protein
MILCSPDDECGQTIVDGLDLKSFLCIGIVTFAGDASRMPKIKGVVRPPFRMVDKVAGKI